MSDQQTPSHDRALGAAADWCIKLAAAPKDPALQEALARWRDSSPEHDRAYRQVEKMWRLAEQLPADVVKETRCSSAPKATLQSAASFAMPRSPVQRAGWCQLATCAVAASLCVALFIHDSVPVERETFATGSAELRTVTLADGSVLSLDAESRLTVTLDKDRRHVDLFTGRVFFDVSPADGRPFTIAAEKLRVTVTGTAFAVSRGKNEVVVAVQSGSVQAATQTRLPENARLRAGDSFSLSRLNERVTHATVRPEDVDAWREGLLVAEGMTLASLIELIDRHYAGTIQLFDPALSGRRITGIFDLNDPQTALRAIAGSQSARLESLPGDVLAILPN